MILDRRNVLKLLPAAASAALATPHLPAEPHSLGVKLRIQPPGAASYLPLQPVVLHVEGSGWENGTIVILDGRGREYLRAKASSAFTFTIGGALGRQTARLLDDHGAIAGELKFIVDCSTQLNDEGGVYHALMEAVLWAMMSWNEGMPALTIRRDNRVYQMFVNWILDHTLILKGLKYFWPSLKDGIDFFADTQREDGMIWENCFPSTPDNDFFDWKFDYDNFVRKYADGFWQLKRSPLESHVEQYFTDGLYATWKATGDTEWMKGKLDTAMRAMRYITKDPYRWSKQHQVMHRGFSIDTWDYVSDDQQRWGGTVFMVYLDKSEFGVFHGDNTNFIFQCRNLAEMLKVAGRTEEAPEFEKLADDVEKRLNALAWNGNFYTHWIAENPDYKPDVGVDMSTQVSLSNALALNRGLSHEKCVSILNTYQRLRREMPASSPGEFYGIYPPFQRDFTLNVPGLVWEYVNGGVLTFVGGELAHGAFEHGFETYGADLLRRMKAIADRYRGYLPCSLRGRAAETPQRTFRPLSIKDLANASHGKNANGTPLWSTDAEVNLAELPYGSQEFQGVPFQVMDPTKTPPSCVILSRQNPYPQTLTIPVGAKAPSIYLLNAADGSDNDDGTAAMLLTFHYADGSSDSQDVQGRGWSFPTDSKYDQAGPRTKDTYRVAWKKITLDEQECGVYATGIDNPHPEREIASLELSVDGAQTKWLILAVTACSAPVFFAPYDDLSSGIPDGWTGSVAWALIEGLAGIKDQGAAFSRTELIPRWESANVPSAEVTVRYPASAGYCTYKYHAGELKLEVEFTGSAEDFDVQILLPPNRRAQAARLDGRTVATTQRIIEQSTYVVLPLISYGVHRLEVDLA